MSSSYQSAYTKFAPVALQMPETSTLPYRGDVRLALVNIRIGIVSVLGTPERITEMQSQLPTVPIDDVLELPDLARALLFSTGKVIARRSSPGDIESTVSKVSTLRAQLLTQAELLAQRGKLDKDIVANIRRGSGKYDMAQDGVDLAGLYTEHAIDLKGLHPFTNDDIDALRTNSEWLLEHLTPAGARKEPAVKSEESIVRDRLWTMIVTRHPWLRKIGYYVYGDAFETYTPKLQSRVSSGTAEADPEALPPN